MSIIFHKRILKMKEEKVYLKNMDVYLEENIGINGDKIINVCRNLEIDSNLNVRF